MAGPDTYTGREPQPSPPPLALGDADGGHVTSGTRMWTFLCQEVKDHPESGVSVLSGCREEGIQELEKVTVA